MRLVTTCHKGGFDEYGYRLLEGWHHFPKSAELIWYTEGYDFEPVERVEQRNILEIDQLVAFKKKYANYVPPEFDVDVVRFSNKVYAVVNALMDYHDIGIWIDADCVPYADMSEEFLRGLLEPGSYIGCFQRKGAFTETGFWIVDCASPIHQQFMSTWQKWYDTDAFKKLSGWTDCHTLDSTIRVSKAKVTNLSGAFGSDGTLHPMAKAELGKYIDHCKGPKRKRKGFSPENEHRNIK